MLVAKGTQISSFHFDKRIEATKKRIIIFLKMVLISSEMFRVNIELLLKNIKSRFKFPQLRPVNTKEKIIYSYLIISVYFGFFIPVTISYDLYDIFNLNTNKSLFFYWFLLVWFTGKLKYAIL